MSDTTTAARVRTGDVITTDYGRGKLEVAYPIHDRFTNPEGTTLDRTRFSGWMVTGERGVYTRHKWVEASYAVGDHRDRVYVHDQLRALSVGYRFGQL